MEKVGNRLLANSKNRCWLRLEEMSNSKVVCREARGVTRVTLNEEGEWSLLINDVDGACKHLQCSGPVSYYVYEDDDGFTYSVRPPPSKLENRC